MADRVEYVFYAITRPTRAGRRIVGADIYPTKTAAKQAYLSWYRDLKQGEREWRKIRKKGWAIEFVTVTIGNIE